MCIDGDGCSVKSGFTILEGTVPRGVLLGKTFGENQKCFESVSFCLLQLLASGDVFYPTCRTGVVMFYSFLRVHVSCVSCATLTLAVVVAFLTLHDSGVSYPRTLVKPDTFCATL